MFGFRSPLDDLAYQSQLGCMYVLGVVGVICLAVWLLYVVFMAVWPWLVLALVGYAAYRLGRWYVRQLGEKSES